ncbi:MAG: polyprenyl synthetase family protein, partial [Dehalococcoidia bacterium]
MSQSKVTTEFIYEPVQAGLAEVEARLKKLGSEGHQQIANLLGHLTKSPGKRVRPAITLLASRFHSEDAGDTPVTMATAVELLHMASLVHDDTVDDSPVRRGIATISSIWGRNVAVLLGDYVFATSGVFVSDTGNVRVVRRFSETIRELAAGELMEIFGAFKLDHTYEQYKERIYNKTASLFRTAAESGAILSGAPETVIHSLTQYGYNLGMAFQ